MEAGEQRRLYHPFLSPTNRIYHVHDVLEANENKQMGAKERASELANNGIVNLLNAIHGEGIKRLNCRLMIRGNSRLSVRFIGLVILVSHAARRS